MNKFGKNKQLINIYNTKFLGLFVSSSLWWNNHIAQLVSRLILHAMPLVLWSL